MTFEEIEHRLKAQLGEIGMNDQYHYELLLDSWRIYLDSVSEIRTNGINIKSAGGLVRINPAINSRNEALKQIVKLSKAFGLEPISRGESIEREDDEMRELIEGK